MRFSYESSTETEESDSGGAGLPRDVKGKGRAENASPKRPRSVRIRLVVYTCDGHARPAQSVSVLMADYPSSVPPTSTTRSTRDTEDRSRLRASTSSDSSLSDDIDSDSDEDDETDSDESVVSFSGSDSEEDEFPVNPTSADLANRRCASLT